MPLTCEVCLIIICFTVFLPSFRVGDVGNQSSGFVTLGLGMPLSKCFISRASHWTYISLFPDLKMFCEIWHFLPSLPDRIVFLFYQWWPFNSLTTKHKGTRLNIIQFRKSFVISRWVQGTVMSGGRSSQVCLQYIVVMVEWNNKDDTPNGLYGVGCGCPNSRTRSHRVISCS